MKENFMLKYFPNEFMVMINEIGIFKKYIISCPFCQKNDPHIHRILENTDTGTGVVNNNAYTLNQTHYYYIYCNNCGACGPEDETIEKAIILWGIREGLFNGQRK